MRGRKAKPTAQKRLEGNPGKRRLNDREPEPPVSPTLFSDPPEFTDPPRVCPWPAYALQEWRRLAAIYPHWITDVDRGLLLECCELYARMRTADEAIATTGGFVITTKAGTLVQNPYIGIARRAFQDYRQACIELGLTPTARSRITVEHEDQPAATGTPAAAGDDYRGFVQ